MANGLVSLILKSLISRSGVNIDKDSAERQDIRNKFDQTLNQSGLNEPGFFVLGLADSQESSMIKLGLSDNWLDSIDKPFFGSNFEKYCVLITDGAGFVITGVVSKDDFEDNMKSESNESWLNKVASLYGVNIEHRMGISEGKELYCDLTNRDHDKGSFDPMFGKTGALPYEFDITWPADEGYYIIRSTKPVEGSSPSKAYFEFVSVDDQTARFEFRPKPASDVLTSILDISGVNTKHINLATTSSVFSKSSEIDWSDGTPDDDVKFTGSNLICSAAIGFVKEGHAYNSWWYSYYSDYAISSSEGTVKFQDAVGLTVQ